MYYTYVLQSLVDGNFYVGYTQNLKQRFELHSKGQVESTRNRLPMKLVYYEACLHQQDATQREKYLQQRFSRRFKRHIHIRYRGCKPHLNLSSNPAPFSHERD